jgi:uncharacterized protein
MNNESPKKVLVSGASGFIGQKLVETLEASGYEVMTLVRDPQKVSSRAIFWNPDKELVDVTSLEGFDAVVNLAGENIGSGRWTEEKKKKILESRLRSTRTLVSAFMRLRLPPKVFISGSAIGYYGNRGEEICMETTSAGTGFLANVCRQWEEAAKPAEERGIRTVLLRTGVVLSREGGALAKMLIPFKLGLGGVLGSGEQYMSWIALEDIVGLILFILQKDSISGPINAVAPNPVTNKEFTQALGKALNRPTILPVPAFLLRLILGQEMADEMLLVSTRAIPEKALSAGYVFKHAKLEQIAIVN